jgi:glycosyltransferase 2 family protein
VRWRSAAGLAFAIAAFAFLGGYIAANVAELRAFEWSVRPHMLVLSIAVQIAGLAVGVLAWQLLLRRMHVRVPFFVLARVRIVSGLARYVPGKVWPFIGAARMASGAGMPPALTITSLLASTVFTLLGALLVAAVLLPLESVSAGVPLERLRWLAPLILLLAHPRVIRLALSIASRLARQNIAGWTGGWLDGIGLVALAAAGWIVSGLALCAFIVSLTPLPAAVFPAVIGIHAFAYVLGQAFFIAPAGLGAKEGTLAALLALYLTLPVAALIAVAVRLWSTTAELVLAVALAGMHGIVGRAAAQR